MSLWWKGALIEVRTIIAKKCACGQQAKASGTERCPTQLFVGVSHIRVSPNQDGKRDSRTAGSAKLQKYLIAFF